MKRNQMCLLAAVVFAVYNAGCGVMPVAKESAELMGTVVEVTVHHGRLKEAESAALKAFSEAKRLEGLLSVHLEGSEVSDINRKAGKQPVRVSDEAFFVIQRAVEYSEISGGAFDITVLPLIELWGFHRGRGRVPGEAEIESALFLVGYEKILMDAAERTVMLERKGMKIDLGGIAKGFIVDRMGKILEEAGVAGALVNAGGDIYALGTSYGGGGMEGRDQASEGKGKNR